MVFGETTDFRGERVAESLPMIVNDSGSRRLAQVENPGSTAGIGAQIQRKAFIGTCATYKKEEVKRIFYGDARIVFLILQGHPYPGTRRVPCGGLWCCS